MSEPDRNSQVATLRALHVPGDPVVLPNVWDAASARVAEKAGFPALATTSGGVAKSLGFRDGEDAPVDEMLAAVSRITGAVGVPVTADMESGYGLPAPELVERLADAGACGLNFEDTDHATGGLRDVAEQAERVAALRAACDEQGADLVINARVDVFVRGEGTEAERMPDGLARAQAYVEAGADSIFPILLAGESTIRDFVSAVDAPLNIYLRQECPPLARLADLGVARVSFGSSLMGLALERLNQVVEALRKGDASAFGG